ncbi:DUF1868 domain-containing protein [Aquiflexum sp.]|uniref:DUF1868 domain-containing protein n=1 Tax=Aquiflexum sp. TaxID=1872584 RepID=UPI003593E958
MIEEKQAIAELDFATYQERQLREISKEGLENSAAKMKAGSKFYHNGNSWQAIPYPGYAVLSMVTDTVDNKSLENVLMEAQKRLSSALGLGDKMYLLPQESFHQTTASALSDKRFEQHIVSKGLEKEYPFLVSQSLGNMPQENQPRPITMKMIGLSIFSSALGVLGIFENELDYKRVTRFRENFYENSTIQNLGIVRTRPFIGHITLAYFGRELLTAQQKNDLVNVCQDINQSWLGQEPEFFMTQAALRQYDDLSAFNMLPDLPIYKF